MTHFSCNQVVSKRQSAPAWALFSVVVGFGRVTARGPHGIPLVKHGEAGGEAAREALEIVQRASSEA